MCPRYAGGAILLCSFLLVIAVSGCATDRVPGGMSSGIDVSGSGTSPVPVRQMTASIGSEPAEAVEPTGSLTLRQALSLALMRNPDLAGSSWDIRAADARRLQASLLPNPEVELEVEDFGGVGARRGFDTAQSTFQIGQMIELGGKRARRTRAAALEKDLARWDYEAKRLDVLTEVAKNFVEVVAAQEKVALSEDLLKLSEQVFHTVSERVKAGKVSPLEETKSGVELANARMELDKAGSTLKGARKRLANKWDQAEPGFQKAEGTLEALRPIPSAEELNGLIARNPDVARYVKETEQRKAAVDVEKAKRIPNITVKGGGRTYGETDDHAFVMSVSVPIPLFDRNQGGILESQAKLSKAKEESRAAVAKANTNLAQAYQELSSAYAEAVRLKDEIIPAAGLSFNSSNEGYMEGKFGFLVVLDAQRTLFESKAKYIEALSAYHKAVAEIERLTGTEIDTAIMSSGK
ncbi:MAG: TolC family protein [Syntrophobacteraceae bacterium]